MGGHSASLTQAGAFFGDLQEAPTRDRTRTALKAGWPGRATRLRFMLRILALIMKATRSAPVTLGAFLKRGGPSARAE